MTPRLTPNTPTGVLYENEEEIPNDTLKFIKPSHRKVEIVWRNVIIFGVLHLISIYGLYLLFTATQIRSLVFFAFVYYIPIFGITAGVHRLYCHRAYKATFPLRLLLVFINTMTYQNSIINWTRDHRVHHKYSETDADPHNAKRGFFFSHIGWLLCRKHPDVIEKGRSIDISDLYEDSLVVFQNRHYYKLMLLCCFILPTVIPMYFWQESFLVAFCVNILRYVGQLHITWSINSVAHLSTSNKPYDKNIYPSEEKIVSFLTFGEGWHNYHHTFPWDYKASELGFYRLNLTTGFIDFFSKIGWAYDLKTVSQEMIKKRILRTGDGSHKVYH